jgi:small subunit ribosomal protein S20
MAQHKSAEKRARQAIRRQERNTVWKSRMRTAIKKVRAAKEKGTAEAELKKTVKLLDQLVARGVIHRNKAANQKSALALHVNKLS